jgi:ribonucleoside-diphosphate reductase alpha chain
MVHRVVSAITTRGTEEGYFRTKGYGSTFYRELTHIILHQMATFNSPVWFNIGVEGRRQQASACFILDVEDDMQSILNWFTEEGMIFKGGSGSGVNLSKIRSSIETLSGGGHASGPISFMRAADSVAGSIKSGGTTRRAAKMVILDADHPDVEEFIWCKAKEEEKAYALGREGYDMDLNGDAWASIQFQNANNSVRVTRDFLQRVKDGDTWGLKTRDDSEEIRTTAGRILDQMAEAAWECGDPGIQYDTNINDWHTTPEAGRINGSNPCSEYMHLDNSACNLASINLLKFLGEDGEFDTDKFIHVISIMIIAQDILVGTSEYPTRKITKNANNFRQLGLGYANLGALLMSMGHAYDSDGGRDVAAAITAIMTGEAYRTSAEMAAALGPFAGHKNSAQSMLNVIEKHADRANDLNGDSHLNDVAANVWFDAVTLGKEHGYRNAQATVLAPTGTIAFMMDCDTTGIEPDLSLIKYKKLVGGGTVKIVNQSVEKALLNLGYSQTETNVICTYIIKQGTIEGAPHLLDKHLEIFDCALQPANGKRYIHHMGHVNMMAVTQPFLSGAISKTINMPSTATVEDIKEVYIEGGTLGLKALAIYRDGSKKVQPLNTAKEEDIEKPDRRRLPDTRDAKTHKFDIAGHEGYFTIGLYEDGSPGEIFIHMSKEGSTISGLMDAFATSVSVALQYGVPLDHLIKKFSHMRFEPSGFTGNKDVPIAKSVIDYIFRWIEKQYTEPQEVQEVVVEEDTFNVDDSPSCMECGSIMKRSGTCYTCSECGTTSGCS